MTYMGTTVQPHQMSPGNGWQEASEGRRPLPGIGS